MVCYLSNMQTITTKKLLSCIFFFLLLTSRSFSQPSPVEALKKLYDSYPQEKLYLWFNKTSYIAGETIFFKAYTFTGYEASLMSTSLHVELYNAEKKLLGTKLLPVISGVSEGSIDIDRKMNEGVYFVRAYTTWMLNFDEQFQFIKPIPVYNTSSDKVLTVNNSKWSISARPEGGSLINGIATKVAVRRYGNSSPGKWSGWLYEESNPAVKLQEFTSLDENVALIPFTPEERKKYQVHVKDGSGIAKTAALPLVQNSGVAMAITQGVNSINCHLDFKDIDGNGNGFQLVGQVQTQVVYHAKLNKTNSDVVLKIPTNDLDNGILHLTLFDRTLQPVAERLVFLNHSKLKFDSTVLVQQNISAEPRAQNKLLLTVDSVNWISYSIMVNDAASSLPKHQDNILSALWLTGDLVLPVQNPASYFDHPDQNKIDALDAMLISEKWTRFNWTDILNNKYPVVNHFPLNYLSYTGRVTKGNKLKANEDVNLFFYYPDSSKQFVQAASDSTGNIFVDNILFMNDARIYYQLNSKKYSAKLIDIKFESNNRFVPYSLPLPETGYTLTAKTTAVMPPDWMNRAGNTLNIEKDIENKYKTLKEVVVTAKLKNATDELNQKLSSGLFKSNSEVLFDFVNQEQNALGYMNILQWLQGRVAGLNVQYEGGNYVAYLRGSPASLYIDEMQAEPDMISSVNISDIAMVKVIKGPFGLLTGSGGGTIAIYTSRGNVRPAQIEPSLPNNNINGYDVARKFFSPSYDIKSVPQPDKDTRDQLLWQTILSPTVALDKCRVDFFNNDSGKRFLVLIQGFTEKGFPVYVEKIIEPAQKAF
jgi:hypothetical protein